MMIMMGNITGKPCNYLRVTTMVSHTFSLEPIHETWFFLTSAIPNMVIFAWPTCCKNGRLEGSTLAAGAKVPRMVAHLKTLFLESSTWSGVIIWSGWWWLEHDFYISIQLGMVIPTDQLIVFTGLKPPTSDCDKGCESLTKWDDHPKRNYGVRA